MKLNREQRQAVEHRDSPLVVYAGPGSGKTLVLQKKYEHLTQDADPRKILGITFTRNAANELASRIAKKTDIKPNIRTFHAVCLSILKRDWTIIEDTHFQIAGPGEQDRIIRECLNEKSLGYKPEYIPLIKQSISRIKKKQELPAPKDTVQEFINKLMSKHKIDKEYNAKLEAEAKLDYDDIIIKTKELMKKERILYELRNRIEYLLLDEAQDTTIAQGEIIYQLNCKNTTIVGDQNQSIYSFAGANPNFMKEFEERTGSRVIHLKQNYRNPKNIIESAKEVIKNNTNYIPQEIETIKEEGREIGIIQTRNEATEARLIAKTIKKYNLNNVCILYRRNDSAEPIEISLIAEGIPYEIAGCLVHNKYEIIGRILTAIRFISKPNAKDFERLLKQQPGIGERTIEKLIEYAEEHKTPLLELDMTKLKYTTEEQNLILEKIKKAVKAAKNAKKKRKIDIILKEIIAYPKWEWEADLRDPNYTEAQDEHDSARAFVKSLIESKASLADTAKEFLKAETNPPVRLMTLHAAKGTESEIVFIIGMEEEIIPDINSYHDIKAFEEERRLVYVGLTRAGEAIILSRVQNRLIGYLNRTQHPSRFIKELTGTKIL